ncbi:MAG TPA: T9SS type A sorting domain-containing protein [Ignavibacteria bacterium]|nr:T9SS type A sorting domain-containing protein [Ignavibacteria bacterium]HMR39484.1 T9SS type A sorting domain-containing protein [Ignavibacteria bacterium]
MNKITIVLFFSLVCFCVNISTAQISDNSFNDLPSSIAIQPDNYFTSPTGVLSDPVTVSGYDNFRLGTDFGEPSIATNPRDPNNSICAFNINNYYYTLNGHDWIKVGVSFPGFSVLGDPVVTFDSIGNAFYVQLYQNGGTYGICVARSTNKGVSFSSTYNVASTTVGLSDKEWIAADITNGPNSNNLYVVWRQFGSSGMRAVRSTDGGATWSSPLTYTGGQGAYVAVGPDGSIQGGSVYNASLNGSTILVGRSTDAGQTYSAMVPATTFIPGGTICFNRYTVKNCIRTDGFPRIAADNSYTSSRGNVYVVYCVNPLTADLADINFVRSTDYGVTWSQPIRVNDDNTTTDQWMPAISVDNKTGKIFISWFDSREDPTNNLLTKIYASVSTNGGQSFTANAPVSNALFNPNNMAVGQPGDANYIGDYHGISAIGNTSYVVWMDGRNNNLGSYTGYYPDFAMTTNSTSANIGNNDSTKVVVKIPSVNGPFTGNVKFSAAIDTAPTSGNISFAFQNGKDSVTSYPDSVTLVIKTNGNIPPKRYRVLIKGTGTNGPPVHSRTIDLYVNTALVNIGTNRPGITNFSVNGVTYTQTQEFVFPLGTNITVAAISPRVLGLNRYVYTNWSNGGDTSQTVSINSNLDLVANYKIQYKLLVNTTFGTTFGGDEFYDSASTATFGVNSRIVISGGTTYYFKGWNGSGNGSYSSTDSTGLDSIVSITMGNPISEAARWSTTTGINQISSFIPEKYNLYQNYPNPFNPVTNIKFDIIKSNNVKVIVYDMIGKEVSVLINEALQPGSYKVDFNGVNLASGIYYYKVVTNEFTDIKKMILIK